MMMTIGSRHTGALVVVALLGLMCAPSRGHAEELLARSSDKEVKSLIVSIGKAEQRFEKSLDRKFKKAILRGSGAEVLVQNYLDDLASAIKHLEKRFTGKYSASAEAQEVLDRASRMHAYVRENPSLKGANEWDAVASQLQQLAISYGATFPLSEGHTVRRIGDGELADAAKSLGSFSRDFERVLRKETGKIPELKEPVTSGIADLKAMADRSKVLASRIKSGKPASAEARQLIGTVQRVNVLIASDNMPETVRASWETGTASTAKIAQAFGIALVTEPEPDTPHTN